MLKHPSLPAAGFAPCASVAVLHITSQLCQAVQLNVILTRASGVVSHSVCVSLLSASQTELDWHLTSMDAMQRACTCMLCTAKQGPWKLRRLATTQQFSIATALCVF
jgi:hypothetical protein